MRLAKLESSIGPIVVNPNNVFLEKCKVNKNVYLYNIGHRGEPHCLKCTLEEATNELNSALRYCPPEIILCESCSIEEVCTSITKGMRTSCPEYKDVTD